jgi:hypothetical protein
MDKSVRRSGFAADGAEAVPGAFIRFCFIIWSDLNVFIGRNRTGDDTLIQIYPSNRLNTRAFVGGFEPQFDCYCFNA